MAILWKVKGYINGNVWGVNEVWPSLLSYEELVALDWLITELNNYPVDYYNKMVTDWHIYTMSAWQYEPFCDHDWYALSDDWSTMRYIWRNRYVYDPETNQRVAISASSEPCMPSTPG